MKSEEQVVVGVSANDCRVKRQPSPASVAKPKALEDLALGVSYLKT